MSMSSFLYLLYTLIKLYYTKALSDQASSLALDWILLLWRPRIPAKTKNPGVFSWFSNSLSIGKPMLCYAMLSCFSCVRLCVTPQTAAHQAPPSLGFSRQEYWSGLPFPSPMHESEKWKKLLSRVQLLATPWTAAHQAPPSMGFSRQEYWSGVPLPSLR